MKPDDLAKSNTEAAHQAALFCWAAMAAERGIAYANVWVTGSSLLDEVKQVKCPELKWLHHIPNGGSRGDNAKSRMIEGGKLKAQGVKAGVLDIFLPVKRSFYSGIYIEMKHESKRNHKNGGMTEDQVKFTNFVNSECFGVSVCYNWKEARDVLIDYLRTGE